MRKSQQGVVLLIALIILVAMTLAGIAMVRSVDTGNIISGNLAFKQSSLAATDRGIQEAFVWLGNNSTVLANSDLSNGYFSSISGDFTGFGETDWDNAKTVGSADAAGNTVEYVIHRLCTQPDTEYNGSNAGVANECSTSEASSPASNAAVGSSAQIGASVYNTSPMVYYRITSRVKGPRNAMSITQATVMIPI
jgi:Tfp pilus assembly protein PilX